MMTHLHHDSEKLNSQPVDGFVDPRGLLVSIDERIFADQTASEVVNA